jgi:hypothetical protein
MSDADRPAPTKGGRPLKAIVYHGPGQKPWEDVPDPTIQANTE